MARSYTQSSNWEGSFPNRPSKRQLEAIRLIAEGMTGPETAFRMKCSLRTLNWHLRQLYLKLNVHNRIAAINVLRQANLL